MEPRLKTFDIAPPRQGGRRRSGDLSSFEHTYKAEVTSIYPLSEAENLYQIRISDPEEWRQFRCRPGQFVMLEVPGIGEAPFSISGSHGGTLELCIRQVGDLTNFLARVRRGTFVGLRGPFGTSFPMEEMHGQNILLIAGGLGLAPLRAPIAYAQENRSSFGNVDIVYGTKNPGQLLFTYQYDTWRKDDVQLHIIVEKADASWQGEVGMITKVIDKIITQNSGALNDTYAIVCGPPVMFKFVCSMLTKAGMPLQKMFVSLERRMHCGMGKCCRCNVGSTYTCLSGPVFDYWTVMNLKEAI